MTLPLVAVSIGCPAGVGPEVAVVAAARSKDARCLLVGDEGVIRRAAELRGVSLRRFFRVEDPLRIKRLPPDKIGVFTGTTRLSAPTPYGKPDAEAGAAQLAWIDDATDVVRGGFARALCTGPVSKHAIATSGAPGSSGFRGHTEHLAARLGAAEVVMAFASKELTTALVTTHLSIAEVPAAITPEAVATSAYWLARLLRARGSRRPRIAVAALNPHAGEGGLLGDEEGTRIVPGIALARERLARDRIAGGAHRPAGRRDGAASRRARGLRRASWRCTTTRPPSRRSSSASGRR